MRMAAAATCGGDHSGCVRLTSSVGGDSRGDHRGEMRVHDGFLFIWVGAARGREVSGSAEREDGLEIFGFDGDAAAVTVPVEARSQSREVAR